MLPRGGECPSCTEYVLWGDVIRACYRQYTGRRGEDVNVAAGIEEEAEIHDEQLVDGEDELHGSKAKASHSKRKAVSQSI